MPWYPGQVAIGQKVESAVFGMARGFWSQPPTVTTPGTPSASGGTVTNSTGFDCMVYMRSTTGIGPVLIGAGTAIAGSATAANASIGIYLPAGQSIIPTFTGTFTWQWLAV